LDEVVNDTPKPSEQESTANAATEKPLTIPFQTPKEEPRILYNKAFQRLNQAQYVEAGKVFESFIKQFPKDPLIGNAYYWLGETYYVRGRYVEAADWFRQGFEILPDGPKANDNLLKLGISLHAQKKKSEACVILKELQKRTEKAGVGIKQKTLKEINRIGC
jgi:tol-pal system protein YbgF